jgi:glyoxylase-like metal-dependent hydrolase (beta-lactamase superfamily II)
MTVPTLSLGDATIARIDEMRGAFPFDHLLPTGEAGALDAHRHWLKPDFMTGAGQLILNFHSFVIRTARHTILVDSCIGDRKHRPLRPTWNDKRGPYLENLRTAGVAPEAIDFVLCTHLHADHVGWNTRLDNGRWVPTFPRARYLFARREFEYWRDIVNQGADPPPNQDSWTDSVQPILDAKQAVIVAQDHAIDDSLHLEDAPGHTPGGVVLRMHNTGGRAVFIGDAAHHPAQCLHPHWSSRFCADPAQSAVTRRRLLESVCDTPEWLCAAHFGGSTFARITRAGDGFMPRFAST